jgi:hypothetical protein
MVTLDRARMIARILISGALLSTVAGSAAAQPATRAHAKSQLFAMQSNLLGEPASFPVRDRTGAPRAGRRTAGSDECTG